MNFVIGLYILKFQKIEIKNDFLKKEHRHTFLSLNRYVIKLFELISFGIQTIINQIYYGLPSAKVPKPNGAHLAFSGIFHTSYEEYLSIFKHGILIFSSPFSIRGMINHIRNYINDT